MSHRARSSFALPLLALAGCARLANMESAYLDKVERPEPMARELDQAMHGFASEGFTGTVLVARGTQVLLYKGYGESNRARELPNNAETRFPLGAVENVLTAAALMQLEADGRISERDLANRFIPGAEPVRIDELLSRSREVTTVAYSGGIARTGEPLADRFAEPGGSYAMLKEIVERASGQPYEQYVREHLLLPSGMTRTFWDNGMVDDSLVARGYKEPEGATVFARGLVLPLADLYRWHLALRNNSVISQESKQRMFSPSANGYGFGLVISTAADGTKIIEHAGDQPGFQTWYAYFPDRDILMLLAVNNDGGWRRPVSERLTEVVLSGVGDSTAVVSR